MEGTPVGVEVGQIIRCIVIVCGLLPTGLCIAAPPPLSEPEALARAEKFADQVVRIIPELSDGTPAPTGFGLVVGERTGNAYIATPYHLAFGLERPSSVGATPVVVFRADRYNTIRARRLDVASAQDDLAVLEVAPPQGLILPRAPMVLAGQLPRGTWVWNIGIGPNWDMPDRAGGLGPEEVVTGRRRVGQLRTPPGASGGAAVTDGGVIGIVLQDATDFSLLLPVERIVQLFKAWQLPVNLLASGPVLRPPPNPSTSNRPKFLSDPRCQEIIARATLGENLSDADRKILQTRCGS